MINITKLYCGQDSPGDSLRYARDTAHRRPIVVWNCTRRCNLKCIHCYSDSENKNYAGELTGGEARAMIDDLAEYKVPVLLFSGGEPFLRDDLFDLIGHTVQRGVKAVISTNGTLIDLEKAKKLKELGVSYVGISLDGIGENNDKFRGVKGAFEATTRAFRACREAGQRAGLRLTLTRSNFQDLVGIFDFIRQEQIPRACFYHLVYCGRGSEIRDSDLSHNESRQVIDLIINQTCRARAHNPSLEILTVDNHADGVYLYRRLLRENPARAGEVYELLKINGGNSSGIGISCVDNAGEVHADQFSLNYSFGNVRNRKFSEIWQDGDHPIMKILRHRRGRIGGRCGRCGYFAVCNGNFRARAEAVYADRWAEDPACYLTEEEIKA